MIKKNKKYFIPDKPGNYFIPLCGTQEVGCNSNIALCIQENKKEQIIIDAGLGMLKNIPGIEQCIPDYYTVDPDITVGVVITHGHLDHFGSLTYLMKSLNKGTPIYATPFTMDIIKHQFKERHMIGNFITVDMNSKFKIGSLFEVQLISVTHSIPETQMITVTYSDGTTLLHTADYKIDEDPVVGTKTNELLLERIGDHGVDYLVSDSTNVHCEEWTKSEGSVYQKLLELVTKLVGFRIVLTSFSSNIARLSSLLSLAAQTNRKIVVLGRSMNRMFEVAQDHQYIKNHEHILAKNHKNLKDSELLIICTGSQGEPRSALHKLSSTGSYNPIKLDISDKTKTAVIFSSKIIPGNELAIEHIKSNLTRRGAHIYDTSEHQSIHASGHASWKETEYLLKLVKPKAIIPVHGTYRLIMRAGKLFDAMGIPWIVPFNGCVIKLENCTLEIVGDMEVKQRGIDGEKGTIIDLSSKMMENRRTLGTEGVLFVNYKVVDNQPEILSFNAVGLLTNNAIKSPEFHKILEYSFSKGNNSEDIKNILQSAIYGRYGKRPIIVLEEIK